MQATGSYITEAWTAYAAMVYRIDKYCFNTNCVRIYFFCTLLPVIDCQAYASSALYINCHTYWWPDEGMR